MSRLSRGHALAHELPVLAVVGKLSLLFAVLMGVPLAFALVQDDGAASAFGAAMAVSAAVGGALWGVGRRVLRELQARDGFLLVVLAWAFLPALAAVPLLLALPGLSVTDAYFESMSGFTTTGATVPCWARSARRPAMSPASPRPNRS